MISREKISPICVIGTAAPTSMPIAAPSSAVSTIMPATSPIRSVRTW